MAVEDYIPIMEQWENPFAKVELVEDVEAMWSDLLRLHPELTDKTPGEHCVEVRAISRKANSKNKHSRATQNFHLWKANNESKERFIQWYHKHAEDKGCCIYYSIHCFDSTIKAECKKAYTINAQNQLFTRVLVADLDHVSEVENRAFDETMDRLNIPFQSVQTSIDGYQKRFYLSNQIDDEYTVAKFTKILINKGFKVDEKLKNRGQIARLVGTINNKCYDPKFKIEGQFKVRIDRDTNKLITAEELFDKINSLETVKEVYKSQYLKLEKVSTVSRDNFKFSAYYEEDKFIEAYKDIIPECYRELLQRPLKHMLIDSPDSFTDAVVMFIIPYFKNTLKLSLEETKSIMDKWAEINSYEETDKYERIYYTEYTKGLGVYPLELQEKYGSINFAVNYKPIVDVIAKINNNTININPKIFEPSIYKELDKSALKVFLCFALEHKTSGKVTWTIKEVMEYCNMSKPTVIKNLKVLTKADFISYTAGVKKQGTEDQYTLTKTFIALKTERRLEFNISEIDRMISKLTGAEIKLFIYMKYMILKFQGQMFYGNQEDIASAIGVKRRAVSTTFESLNKKRFINIDKKVVGKFESNSYTLLI